MKRSLIAATLALATAAGGIAAVPQTASAQAVVISPGGVGLYAFGGHRYCWYEGWHGPGWYWCGYGWRRGYGWGGGYGFHGWGRGGGHYGGGHGGYGGGHGGYGGGHGGYGGGHGGGGGGHGGGHGGGGGHHH